MKQNKKLQSRREFFKEASEKALPILGMALFASTPILNSCTKDSTPSECNGCSNNCEGNSTSSVCSSCNNNCQNSSTSTGCSSCSDGCENSSTNSGCDNCSSGCDSGCINECSNNCSNSANNSSNDTISEASGLVGGHEYVDLGLSVMWARCNVGATLPHKSGKYARVPYFNLSDAEKYSILSSLGLYTGNEEIADLGGVEAFDLATENWGTSWKTPSNSEWQELRENCNFEAFELEGVAGVKIISQINGKSIFIPLSGEYLGDNLSNIGSWVILHTSTFNIRYFDISSQFFQTYRTSSGEIKHKFFSSLFYNKCRPFTRAVTTGLGGGSTSCNGNCTNTAQNNCSSCQVGCSNGCSQQCASNCSTGCKSTCQGTCPNGCSTLCGGACKSSCGGTCSYVSSGSSCTSGTCATTCRNYCFRTCSLACSESCMSCCITSSK